MPELFQRPTPVMRTPTPPSHHTGRPARHRVSQLISLLTLFTATGDFQWLTDWREDGQRK